MSGSADAREYADEFLAGLFDAEPVTATFAGAHADDARLPDWSEAELLRRESAVMDIVIEEELGELAATLRDGPEQLDFLLAVTSEQVRKTEDESGHFVRANPALWTGEAIFGLVSLMLRDFAPAEQRAGDIASRLRDVPRFLADLPAVVGRAERIPTVWRARAVRECETAQRLITSSLGAWCSEHGVAYMGEAAEVANDAVARTMAWLAEGSGAALDPRPIGEEAMVTLLESGHHALESPHELLRRAEAAMEEEREALAADVYVFPGQSWSAVQAAIAADHPAPRDFYAAFERRWSEIREATSDIVTWPESHEWPIRYRPFPVWARDVAPSLYWLFYRSPSPYDPPRTHDYWTPVVDESLSPDVLGARLATWNNTQITLNHVVHHGGLGHHVQNWHATTHSRSQIGRIAAVDAASRIALFCGGTMAEGWACYATGLVEERGLLTRLERLSEQHTRVRLLARCVVDLRFHLGDWSFDECVAYWQRTTEMSREVAVAELTKISMFPGTGLMYWLGVDAIKMARRALERRHGASFSLKRFHDDFLSWGSIPAPLVARMLTA